MALSTLRLLCSDLKTDKKWRQYAGAQVQCSLPRAFVLMPAGVTNLICDPSPCTNMQAAIAAPQHAVVVLAVHVASTACQAMMIALPFPAYYPEMPRLACRRQWRWP